MIKTNISDIRERLAARKVAAKAAQAEAMQPIEWESEMIRVAQITIAAETPVGHEYLIPVLSKLIQSDSSQGMMKFFIEYPPSGGITTHAAGSWGNESQQMEALKAITMDQIIYWVANFKDKTNVDSGLSDEDIASNVWHAIHGKENSNPEAFINPGSHKGHDPKTSLLAVGGHYGASLTERVAVSHVLQSVLSAWKAYMATALPNRTKRIMSGEAAGDPVANPF